MPDARVAFDLTGGIRSERVRSSAPLFVGSFFFDEPISTASENALTGHWPKFQGRSPLANHLMHVDGYIIFTGAIPASYDPTGFMLSEFLLFRLIAWDKWPAP